MYPTFSTDRIKAMMAVPHTRPIAYFNCEADAKATADALYVCGLLSAKWRRSVTGFEVTSTSDAPLTESQKFIIDTMTPVWDL